ncbi:MAG: hypothetical protein JRN26_06135 [Nitrososphaerota archaeon]|nr:hypothetical protein [Nitrososphaerota archaeon]MDG6927027.1 hypothetical protein [Nitrososphaerota archaeon]MDG6930412.1 hypothetical protein [Nitrososphaerota archaeon]MDG6931453.1 hypothetical protein [Nitrososphaerota archaeon]MDG6936442.1 hypothetical protein [Nitrososphaerota archaeon]
MPRSNIAVDKQLAQWLANTAESKNKPIYALTNEIIKIGLDLIDGKVEINELPTTVKIMKMMKDLDVVPVPGDLMDLMIKMLYLSDREQLMQIGFREGEELGNYFSTFYKSMVELISSSKDVLVQIFPLKRLELEPTSVNGEKAVYTLRAIGVGRSRETTEFVKEVMRGMLSVYKEVRVIDIRSNNGFLELEFQMNVDELNKIAGRNFETEDFRI